MFMKQCAPREPNPYGAGVTGTRDLPAGIGLVANDPLARLGFGAMETAPRIEKGINVWDLGHERGAYTAASIPPLPFHPSTTEPIAELQNGGGFGRNSDLKHAHL